ncbi:hypothetical protein MMC14_008748 [Varicellaria rhodocarpa]|nr:hypothetical protein [Varicellaria rhodocarpa]
MENPTYSPSYARQNIGPRTVNVAIAFIVLEFFFVGLRFASRHVSKIRAGLDDVFILPSLVFCLGLCALAIVEVKIAGVGQHEDVLLATNPTAVVHWAKAGYAIEELYCTAVIFPKLSILGFYLRIFTTKLFRITVYIIAGILIVNGIAGVITSLSTCQPFAARWDPSIPGAHCINTPQYWRWISFANIATDVVMLCLPLPAVWRLHVSTAQKYGLTLVFLTGSIGLISSIIRFDAFFDVKALVDGTWASANLAIWSAVEPGVYLIAACLPNLRPLIWSIVARATTVIHTNFSKKSLGLMASSANSGTPPAANSVGFSRLKDREHHSSGNVAREDMELTELGSDASKGVPNRIMVQREFEVSG